MKRFLILLPILALSGCTTGISKVVRELAKDPATVRLSVRSIYVTLDLERTAPNTNSMAHIVKDREIHVGPQ